MTKIMSIEQWESVCHVVFSVLLMEQLIDQNTTNHTSAVKMQLRPHHFPNGVLRDVFVHYLAMRQDGQVVNPTTFKATYTGSISDAMFSSWISTYSNRKVKRGESDIDLLSSETFDVLLAKIIDTGNSYLAIDRFAQAQQDILNGKAANDVIQDIASTPINGLIETTSAPELSDHIRALLTMPPRAMLSTGIAHLDTITGGVDVNGLTAVVGTNKSRKTTLALNVALELARQGALVTIAMYESNRQLTAASLVSMLAVKYLIENGQDKIAHDLNSGHKIVASDISGQAITSYRNRLLSDSLGEVSKVRRDALAYAIGKFHSLPISIYDKTSSGGRLSTAGDAVSYAIADKLKHKARHGDKPHLLIVDHAQRVGEDDRETDYQRLVRVARHFETARNLDLTVWLLSQTRSQFDLFGESGSSGAAGGDVLDAASTHVVGTTTQKKKPGNEKAYPNTVMGIALIKSRYQSQGVDGTFANVYVHPPSGLILEGGRTVTDEELGVY